MRLMKSHVIRIFILLFLVSSPVWAQLDLHDWNNVKNIARGSDVWVKGAHGNVSGAFESADDHEIRLLQWRRRPFIGGSYSQLRAIPRDEVRQVRFAKRGLSAVAGAAIGVGAGVGIGMGVEAQYPNSREDGHLLSAVLGLLGGLIGERIGEHTAFVHGAKIYAAK